MDRGPTFIDWDGIVKVCGDESVYNELPEQTFYCAICGAPIGQSQLSICLSCKISDTIGYNPTTDEGVMFPVPDGDFIIDVRHLKQAKSKVAN